MERREFVAQTALGSLGIAATKLEPAATMLGSHGSAATRKILIAGGIYNDVWIKYMATLTGKPRPRICYLPTASADHPEGIIRFYADCSQLNVVPFVQTSFISSYDQKQTFAEVLLSMDAIVCSGGNTLNQQVIWKAQGIDQVLRDAWDRGIVLGGASAGSLCWFEEGTTDSRPKELSIVLALGLLKGSHCPHYDAEGPRRPLYMKLIGSGQMKPGYACYNQAGIYFEDNEVKRVVASHADAKVFYVSVVNGQVAEKELPAELIS